MKFEEYARTGEKADKYDDRFIEQQLTKYEIR